QERNEWVEIQVKTEKHSACTESAGSPARGIAEQEPAGVVDHRSLRRSAVWDRTYVLVQDRVPAAGCQLVDQPGTDPRIAQGRPVEVAVGRLHKAGNGQRP